MDSEIASRKRAHGYIETSSAQGNPICPTCGSRMQVNNFGDKAKCHECGDPSDYPDDYVEYEVSRITRVFVKTVEKNEENEDG
jgi:tRNA(Ile2) C34 agmatinyltransferase TiaS